MQHTKKSDPNKRNRHIVHDFQTAIVRSSDRFANTKKTIKEQARSRHRDPVPPGLRHWVFWVFVLSVVLKAETAFCQPSMTINSQQHQHRPGRPRCKEGRARQTAFQSFCERRAGRSIETSLESLRGGWPVAFSRFAIVERITVCFVCGARRSFVEALSLPSGVL